jgi:hypothetical protein
MPTPLDNEVLRMDGWPKGVNNRLRETESEAASKSQFEIPASPWLRKAVNVDLTSKGHPLRRAGYTQVLSGYTHSFWSDPRVYFALVVRDGVLTALNGPDLAQTPIREVTPFRPVSYAPVNGDVYWSNGLETGIVTWDLQDVAWGLSVAGQPTVAAVAAGGLFPGLYHVACTYTDAQGAEHGASEPVSITVIEGQGIVVTAPTAPSGAVRWNVYCTQANSEAYYQTHSVIVALSQVTVSSVDMGIGKLLETLDRHPPKPGHIVRYGNGRIFVARHDTVTFTDPLVYHLMQPARGMYWFDTDVQLMEPVREGLFVGIEGRMFFLAGSDPYDVRQRLIHSAGPVPGAVAHVAGERLGVPGVDSVPVFWTQDGAMWAGLPDGTMRSLTRDRFAVSSQRKGAMMLRNREGMSHVVSVLAQAGEGSTMAATDSVVAEIRRNCVKLN